MLHRSIRRPGCWLPALLMVAACWPSAAQHSAAAADTDYVEAHALRRIRIVPAVYPQVAKDNAFSGMVELKFTIRPDGSTADIVVVRSEPAGLFEVSAITALAQWLYEPVVRNGQPVAQRAMIRIRFHP